jgi:hypothetical protein
MNRTEQAAAKRQAELQEALGHLEYFKRTGQALDQAMKAMEKDLQVCKKNEQIWEKRIEKLQEKA